MSDTLVRILLAVVLVLPLVGALLIRFLRSRLAPRWLYAISTLIFGTIFVSVLLLARGNVTTLQISQLSLLQPISTTSEQELSLPPFSEPPFSGDLEPTQQVETATPTTKPTTTPTEEATKEPTKEPTQEPTAEPTEQPTQEPTAEPTEQPTATQQTYTVQPGDTLRSIAEKFDVSVEALVEANNLTPEEADSLQVGQELIIP